MNRIEKRAKENRLENESAGFDGERFFECIKGLDDICNLNLGDKFESNTRFFITTSDSNILLCIKTDEMELTREQIESFEVAAVAGGRGQYQLEPEKTSISITEYTYDYPKLSINITLRRNGEKNE